MCKIAERMVLRRLERAINHLSLLDDTQAGFIKHRSTMDHVVNFSQHIKDGFHRKMSTVTAYDTVWREMLLHKIAQAGIAGNLFHWVKSFLGQRTIRARVNNHTSRYQGIAFRNRDSRKAQF
jgi:hypothetical protein